MYLIEDVYKNGLHAYNDENKDLKWNDYENTLYKAIRIALNEVIGAYAIVVMDQDNPNELYAARKGSPLVIGIGNDEYFVASDASPIIEYTAVSS